jgi:transposase
VPSGSLAYKLKRAIRWRPEAQRLMTHPGVGALTALSFVLIIGKAERFRCGKQVASYLGLVPLEESSGNRRRLGHITQARQFNVAFLAGGGASHGAQSAGVARKYLHLMTRHGRKIAKVAMARRPTVRLYLDDASGMGLRAVDQVRFARGTARTSPWCADEHREIDCASRSSSPRSSK